MRIEVFSTRGENWISKTLSIAFLNTEILTLFLDYLKACIIPYKKEIVSLSNYFSSSMLHADSRLKINSNGENIGAIVREFYLGIGQIPDLLLPANPDLPCNIALPADAKVVIPKHMIGQLQEFGAIIQSAHNILIQENTYLLKDLWVITLGYLTSNDNIEMVTALGESKISSSEESFKF